MKGPQKMELHVLSDVRHSVSREAILGHDTSWKVSDLGLVQFRHGYDPALLKTIREKALEIKEEHAIHKHLDLKYIPAAHQHIPEIEDLINDPERLDRLSDFAGTRLEPYPISVIKSAITFMGPNDGSIEWYADGVPLTELIPLSISDPIVGGELEVFLGNTDEAQARQDRGADIEKHEAMRIPHKMNYSTLGQMLGVLHRTQPIHFGERITLNLNLRSVEKPYIDDNRLFYLAADNDEDRSWVDEVVADLWQRQLPAYRQKQKPVDTKSRDTRTLPVAQTAQAAR